MRTILMAALAAALVAPGVRADTVSMPDKIELSGKKVEILEIRENEVLVRVAYGEIAIPRSRIIGMEVNFRERLARLKEDGRDTPRALFALGKVCSRLGMTKEAARAYHQAVARDDVPEDLLLPMAGELERYEAWGAAHKCYQAYLKAHPDDAAAQAKARAAATRAAKEPPQAESPTKGQVKIAITEVPATQQRPAMQPPPPEQQPKQPPEQQPKQPPEQQPKQPPEQQPKQPPEQQPQGPKVDEGLEADAGWSTEAWGSTVEISVGAPQGTNDTMLRAFLAGAEKDKINLMIEEDFDLTGKKAMTLEVYNFTKKHLNLAVAFINLPGWKFYESLPVTVLPTGDNPKRVSFDLTTSRFKCAETKWRHKSRLKNPATIKKIYLLIYTDQTGEWVYFNNIRFEPAKAAAQAPDALNP